MNPEDLAAEPRKNRPEESAPSAAAWLRNPESIEKRKTLAQLLIEDLEKNGEWKGPPLGHPDHPDYDPLED